MVKGCSHLTYIERLTYLNLFSLKYRRFRGSLFQTFKIINEVDDVNPNDLQFYTFNNGNTRYADFKIFNKGSKLEIRKYCFSNRTARAWNNLAIKTRKAKTVKV